ncbi:MAG TPA: hypothetical protein VGC57_00030, partial [Cellulomonas sp.]
MTGWLTDDPGAGDPASVLARARALDTLVRLLDRGRSDYREQVETMSADVWSGAAADAFRASGAEYLDRLDRLIEALAPRSTALAAYGNAIDDLADEAAALRAQWGVAQDDIDTARGRLPRGVGAGAATASVLLQITDAQAWQARLERQMQELLDDRRTADRRVLDELADFTGTGLAEVGRAMSDAGVGRPGAFDTSAIRSALLALSAGARQGDEDAIAGLRALLDSWATDPVVLDAYLRGLGGDGLAELVVTLDIALGNQEGDPAVVVALARTLQRSLATVSRTWDAATAEEFAAELFAAPYAPATVGFLFCDPDRALIGETLTVATADLVDRYERAHGRPWTAMPPLGGLHLARAVDPEHPGRAADPAAGVLDTLAHHPDAALTWITSGRDVVPGGTSQLPRIDHWFGSRDWGSDGFEAVANLWEGMQHATGGPLSDPAAYDAQRWDLLVTADAAVFAALGANVAFLPETTSTEAQRHLVNAVSAMLPLLTESSVYMVVEVGDEDGNRRGERPTLATKEIPGLGDRPVPIVLADDLARLLGVACHDDEPFADFAAAVRQLQDDMLATVGRESTYGPLGAIERAAVLQALLDGASGG